MAERNVQRSRRRGYMAWSTREILVTAAICLAFAVVLIPYTYLAIALTAATGPVTYGLTGGLWLTPSVIILYVIRRPGSAILAQILTSLMLVPVTPFGLGYLLNVLTFGVPCEVAFALVTRYRHFGLPRVMVAAAFSWVLQFILGLFLLGYINLGLGAILLLFVTGLLGYALVGGLLGKALADAVAKTGVLSGLALTRETEET